MFSFSYYQQIFLARSSVTLRIQRFFFIGIIHNFLRNRTVEVRVCDVGILVIGKLIRCLMFTFMTIC
ncbi:hypothetical protein F0562_021030 [Nyssa sinensis]|uniref:Uncharacterized protein n=1 Tax=Nyssa sinensis TaxID=561372 RepID=A0A5J5BK14_9ASTE|nr:hypothetical protein F0562_021030 [Nyssa sinensis]